MNNRIIISAGYEASDRGTFELYYDVTVAIGDTALPEAETSAVEPKAEVRKSLD